MFWRLLAVAFLLSSGGYMYNAPPPPTMVDASYSQALRRTCVGAAACCVPLACCLKIITTGDECLVERFGKYNRKLGPGWHLILPLVESVSFQATTREQVLDVPPQQCYTLDNAPIRADAVVYAVCMYYSLTFIIIDIMHRTIFHS